MCTARLGTLHGPSMAWLSVESSAEPLTRRAPILWLLTSTSTTTAPSRDAVVLLGDFNKAVEGLPGGSGYRRISSLEAAFSAACVFCRSSGVIPLWGQRAPWQHVAGVLRLRDVARVVDTVAHHGHDSFGVSTFVLDLKSSKRSAPGTLPWLLIRTVMAVHKDKRCIRPLGNNLNQVSNASTQLTEYMMSPPDPLSCFRTSDRSGANCTRDCRGSVSSIYLRSQLGGRSKIRDTFVF